MSSDESRILDLMQKICERFEYFGSPDDEGIELVKELVRRCALLDLEQVLDSFVYEDPFRHQCTDTCVHSTTKPDFIPEVWTSELHQRIPTEGELERYLFGNVSFPNLGDIIHVPKR